MVTTESGSAGVGGDGRSGRCSIFLMSGSTGGFFPASLTFAAYFENAAGLKDGAPVTLEGVTIGNVQHVRVVPDRNPTPVEVTMRVGHRLSSRPAHRLYRHHCAGWRAGRQLSGY